MPRYKYRPCPGCGKEEPLGPQTLCGACERLLAYAKQAEDREAARRASGEEVVVMVGSDWLYDSRLPQVHTLTRELVNGMRDAICKLSGGSLYQPFTAHQRTVACNRPEDRHTGRAWVGMSTEQADAAEKLSDGIRTLLRLVADASRKQELSFVVKLASGEATVADYENRIVSGNHR